MTHSRSRSNEEALNNDFLEAKETAIRLREDIRNKKFAPSELRQIFTRIKCCDQNCMITKLKMPLATSSSSTLPRQRSPNRPSISANDTIRRTTTYQSSSSSHNNFLFPSSSSRPFSNNIAYHNEMNHNSSYGMCSTRVTIEQFENMVVDARSLIDELKVRL